VPGPSGCDANPQAGSEPYPLALRLALLSFPYHQSADLAGGQLARAAETLMCWRRLVAEWAELPSRPVPAATAEAIRGAFDDLDTVQALALLRSLSQDSGLAEGARFEAFLYADRILGLGLPAQIGQPRALPAARPAVIFAGRRNRGSSRPR
jgi:cysteinyl-tRNA synthetase